MEAISVAPKSQPMPTSPRLSQSAAYMPPLPARIIQELMFFPSKLIYICIIPLCCISYRIEWRGLSGCGGCLQFDGNGNVWAIIALQRNRVPQPQLRIGYGQRAHRLIRHDGRHVAPAYLFPTSARYGSHRGGLRLWQARILRVLGNWHQGSCVSGFDSADKMHENTGERF